MAIHWNILLLLCGALQGLMITVFLLGRKASRISFIFLSAYISVLILQIIFKVGDKLWLLDHLTMGYSLSYYFTLLYGPLIWLFARTFFARKRFQTADLVHFAPFVYCGIAEAFYRLDPSFEWMTLPFFGWPGVFAQLISLSIYHWQAYKEWKGFNMPWFGRFVLYSMITGAVISILVALIYVTYPDLSFLRYGFILITIFIYWISYNAWKQPDMYAVVTEKYASSTLSNEEAGRIQVMLTKLMVEDKIYTNPQLTADSLSAQLHTSRHSLSQVLNQHLQQSFSEYINSFRLEEAKKLLSSPSLNNVKIASLAFDAGFNSLSVFNDVFKRKTGLTPSAFRNSTPRENIAQSTLPKLSVR